MNYKSTISGKIDPRIHPELEKILDSYVGAPIAEVSANRIQADVQRALDDDIGISPNNYRISTEIHLSNITISVIDHRTDGRIEVCLDGIRVQ